MIRLTMDEVVFNRVSPHQVSVISAQTPKGITNLTPVSWWTFLESEPPMIGFSLSLESYTCELAAKTGKVVVSFPGEAIAEAVFKCGSVTGREVNKAKEYGIELAEAPIGFPVHSRLAFICTVNKKVEAGECIFFVCDVDEILFNENETQLYARGGSDKLAVLSEIIK